MTHTRDSDSLPFLLFAVMQRSKPELIHIWEFSLSVVTLFYTDITLMSMHQLHVCVEISLSCENRTKVFPVWQQEKKTFYSRFHLVLNFLLEEQEENNRSC